MIFDIIKTVISTASSVINKSVKDKDLATKLEHELEMEINRELPDLIKTELEAQKAIIVAEAQGGSSLQRNWRPLTMLNFLLLINGIFIAGLFGRGSEVTTALSGVPQDLWSLLTLGIGGYIAGRTIEKSVNTWKNGGKK